MEKNSRNYYYRPVPGSRGLITHSSDSLKELIALEKAKEDEDIEIEYKGEKLHKFSHVGVLDSATIEKSLKGLDPLQQTVFLHILLLSAARGADWCRVGMKELAARTQMSRRRLLCTLSELAAGLRIKPLDRNVNGTLYKVYSVLEVKDIGEKTASGISVGQSLKKTAAKTAKQKSRKKPIESPINEEFFPTGKKVVSIKDIAKKFFDETGIAPDDVKMDEAIGQITYLLEDGFSRDEVWVAIEYVAWKLGKKAAIDQLPYYIRQAIEEDEE